MYNYANIHYSLLFAFVWLFFCHFFGDVWLIHGHSGLFYCGAQVCSMCDECVVEDGEGVEVRVWAVRVMREVVTRCSDCLLRTHSQRWTAILVSALEVR